MIDVLWLDGTWMPNGGSPASEAFRRNLNPARYRFRYVPYPAQYGPATGPADMPYLASTRIGASRLAEAVAASPNPAIVGGYSQGAAAAIRYMREILPNRPDHVVWAYASLGDPHTQQHAGRSGIAGALQVSWRRFTLWAGGDPIADLPDGAPLRTIADLTAWMGTRDLDAVEQWGQQLLAAAKAGRLQNWWRLWDLPAWASTVGYARGYLYDGRHNTAYVDDGVSARLAVQLNDARF